MIPITELAFRPTRPVSLSNSLSPLLFSSEANKIYYLSIFYTLYNHVLDQPARPPMTGSAYDQSPTICTTNDYDTLPALIMNTTVSQQNNIAHIATYDTI